MSLCSGYLTQVQRAKLGELFSCLKKLYNFAPSFRIERLRWVDAFGTEPIRSVLLHFLCHSDADWRLEDDDLREKDVLDRWLGYEF